MRAPQFFRTALAIGYKRDPWQLQLLRKSASCGIAFSSLNLFAFATALLVACPPRADQAWRASQLPGPPRTFTSGLSEHWITPCACRI